ncbi:MAG: hypothetical protein ACUVRD_09065 [Bacteroidia bacterium]
MRCVILGLTVLLAQESPNSYVSLSFGAATPTGSFGAAKKLFPIEGYANTGFSLGGQLQTFVMPYFSLGFNAQYLALPLRTAELQKDDRLFSEPTEIPSKVNYTLFLGGFGAGTGLRFNAFSLYVPIYLAFATLKVPEIRGELSNRDFWVQEATGGFAIGFSTGVIFAIALTDDIGASLNFLYHGLSTKDIEFTQKKYDAGGDVNQVRTFTSSLAPQLAELGIGLQYYF